MKKLIIKIVILSTLSLILLGNFNQSRQTETVQRQRISKQEAILIAQNYYSHCLDTVYFRNSFDMSSPSVRERSGNDPYYSEWIVYFYPIRYKNVYRGFKVGVSKPGVDGHGYFDYVSGHNPNDKDYRNASIKKIIKGKTTENDVFELLADPLAVIENNTQEFDYPLTSELSWAENKDIMCKIVSELKPNQKLVVYNWETCECAKPESEMEPCRVNGLILYIIINKHSGIVETFSKISRSFNVFFRYM